MNEQERKQMIGRRGDLLAELFLQEFNPAYLARPADDVDGIEYDYFIGFSNPRGGLNTYGVEVQATEHPVRDKYRLDRTAFEKLAFANIPSMLLVIDVKQNELFYSWLTESESEPNVPVTPLDEHHQMSPL